jgi:hypothetical protein
MIASPVAGPADFRLHSSDEDGCVTLTRNRPVIRKALCPRCGQTFTFETDDAPAQRAQLRGCRSAPVIAHYPVCTHCRQTVEIPDPDGASRRLKRRYRRAR